MAKVVSVPVLCILCVNDEGHEIVQGKLDKWGIDVVETYRLDDGFILLVVGVDELPPIVAMAIEDYSWSKTHTRRGLELFLSETKRGTPSNRIFNSWK